MVETACPATGGASKRAVVANGSHSTGIRSRYDIITTVGVLTADAKCVMDVSGVTTSDAPSMSAASSSRSEDVSKYRICPSFANELVSSDKVRGAAVRK